MKIYTELKHCIEAESTSLNSVLAFHWRGLSTEDREQGKLNPDSPFTLVNHPGNADISILPRQWTYYLWHNRLGEATTLGQDAARFGKRILIWFRGDLPPVIPVPNAVVFQSAIYRSKRKPHQFAAPYFIEDPTLKYSHGKIVLRPKGEKPIVGFCGYAGIKALKMAFGMAHSFYRNISSSLGRSNYESDLIIPATLLRARALRLLSGSDKVNTNFIIRDKHKAGFKSKDPQLESVASQFFTNLYNSDYTLCIRGYGNWSVRFYETLACGRIPVFVDTDCVLPFGSSIDWKKYCVWVDRKELPYVAEKVADFHSQITADEFLDLQKSCRRLWEDRLSLPGFMRHIGEPLSTCD